MLALLHFWSIIQTMGDATSATDNDGCNLACQTRTWEPMPLRSRRSLEITIQRLLWNKQVRLISLLHWYSCQPCGLQCLMCEIFRFAWGFDLFVPCYMRPGRHLGHWHLHGFNKMQPCHTSERTASSIVTRACVGQVQISMLCKWSGVM